MHRRLGASSVVIRRLWGRPNLYAFCMADPVNFFDANGCFPISYDDVVNAVWQGIRNWDASQKFIRHYLPVVPNNPIPGSLLGAHGMHSRTGAVRQGIRRYRLHDTQVDAAYAALHFADAAFNCAGPALAATRALSAAGEAVGACKGGLCFVAGTPVWVAQQDKCGTWQMVSKSIETVKQGEYVLARNEQTGKTSVRKVLRTTIKHAQVTVLASLWRTRLGKSWKRSRLVGSIRSLWMARALCQRAGWRLATAS